ncbi:phasin family protein [Pseudochelatococcus contaminans]|uniref:Phasin domain-containing protein n=1 Tax=Pseudochelatococcus contaminans TaxID=1538103 RepID=A0A7W5Z2L8_9HYPH|nr:phasin family protein [Pseudochelatococcus contaminans]MBB3808659.1 hypothetical protein [Pseudochelatococcus contaminans]
MATQYDNFQNFGKENIESSLKAFNVFSKGLQTVATELVGYSKKSFEEGSAALEKLAATKSLDKAIEVQTEYARKSYENFVQESAKIGEIYKEIAQEAFRPYEGAFNRAR